MLLIGFLLSVTVGLANTSVNEPNRSDEVVLVNDVLDITNQVAIETAFGLKKVDNHASAEKVIRLKLKAYGEPYFYNTNVVLLCYENEGGRSPPERVVKNLQHKNIHVKALLS